MLGLGASINRGGFVSAADPLFLDTYTGASAAYSLRKLSNTYSGPALQVRRASDNVEVDVSFDVNGVVSLNSDVTNVTEETTGSSTSLTTSSTTLGEFVANASYTDADSLGSTDSALVQRWYDQSGNSNGAIQSTAGNQPKIVSSGSLVTQNGKPAIDFDGSNDGLNISPAILASSQKYTFTVHAVDSGDTTWSIFCETTTTDVVPLANSGSGAGIVFGYTLNSLHKDGGSAFSGTRNDLYSAYTSAGQTLTTIDFSGDGIGSLFQRNGFIMTGTAQEIVIYGSDQSSNRTGIETNINTFYDIY